MTDKPKAERRETDNDSTTVFAMVDALSGQASATAVTRNGPESFGVKAGSAFLKVVGRPRMVLHTDGEPAVKSWADAVQREWPKEGNEIQTTSPAGSRQSNGLAENMV